MNNEARAVSTIQILGRLLSSLSWLAIFRMDFEMLRMSFFRPRQDVNFRHKDIVVRQNFDFSSEPFLDFLDQLEMDLRWMDLFGVGIANKSDSPRFLDFVVVICLDTATTEWGRIRIIIHRGAFRCSIPPIAGGTGGRVRHGQDLLVQNVQGIHVETSKGILICLSEKLSV